jgi:hypothetical protein
MTLTRILITAFATAIAGGAHAAGPEHELCRIWTCTIASPTATASLVPEPHPAAVTVGAQTLPVTDRTTVAPSTDGKLYACVGYDPFGDAELMCLLAP